MINTVINSLLQAFTSSTISKYTIVTILAVSLILAIYEHIVYRLVSHRSFYNKAFNIALTVIPLFISTIIMTLQTNYIVTLGTIGALAIIRFRTAVKDPMDMIYVLWSVHTGIMCGCQLYEVSIITSLLVTIVLLMLNKVSFGSNPYIIVFRGKGNKDYNPLLKQYSRKYRIKSRSYIEEEIDYVIEVRSKNISELAEALKNDGITKLSVVEYDSEDII